MKHGILNKPKFELLRRDLGWSRAYARGVLDCLFEFVGRECMRGDIGSHSDEEIGIGMALEPQDADRVEMVIAAMIKRGWLARHADPRVRLFVVDWAEECPDFVRKKLHRKGWSIIGDGGGDAGGDGGGEEPSAADNGAGPQPTVDEDAESHKSGGECPPSGGQRRTTADDVRPAGQGRAGLGMAGQGGARSGPVTALGEISPQTPHDAEAPSVTLRVPPPPLAAGEGGDGQDFSEGQDGSGTGPQRGSLGQPRRVATGETEAEKAARVNGLPAAYRASAGALVGFGCSAKQVVEWCGRFTGGRMAECAAWMRDRVNGGGVQRPEALAWSFLKQSTEHGLTPNGRAAVRIETHKRNGAGGNGKALTTEAQRGNGNEPGARAMGHVGGVAR